MKDRAQIAGERRQAVEILSERGEQVIKRWVQKIRLLTVERGAGRLVEDAAFQEYAREFLDMVVSRLEGMHPEADIASFYHLVLQGRQHNVRLADITYGLLELKSVSKQFIFESLGDEVQAFRVSREVDDVIEAILRRSAELYELTSEADQKTAQERLQEIFAAWDIEGVLADAQTPAEVCRRTARKLEGIWDLLACRVRFGDPMGGAVRDLTEGPELPVPVIREQPQYLTGQELEAGAVVNLLERARRRREEFICWDLEHDDRVVNSPELLEAGVRSMACCPLISGAQVRGALLLYSGQPNVFRQSDSRRLRDFSGVLALALDRTGRLERSRKEISEAEVIARIGRSLLELPTREALLQGVVEALRAFRNYLDVSLFRVDQDAGECVLIAEAGRERRYRPDQYRQRIGQGCIGLCARTGETVRASKLQEDSRRVIAFEEEHRARSELVVPVRKGEEVLGVMHILSEREEDFPETDIAALEHVSPHIGVTLQNARMIVQRRHDRYEIEQAHRELTSIIRSTAVGITSTDTWGVYTHWSPSCETMFGYQSEEVVGSKTPADFAAEPYDAQAALAECLREGQTTVERTMLRKDGSARIIRETRVPMYDEQGQHVGFTAYLVDITEQKRAEERLRQELDTLNVMVDAMGAGLALFDDQLRMQWANAALMKWFNFGPEAFGKSCGEILAVGSWTDPCPAAEAVAAGQLQSRVQEVTEQSGAWHCYQHVFTPVAHGSTRLLLLTLDITEQRRQTEEMRLINKLTEKVETSLDLERVLHLVLTCVTAGHAIGCNRAFVFLLDEEGMQLEGKMALGPVSAADAHRIWSDLSEKDQTIDALLDSAFPSESDRRLTDRVRSLHIPLSRDQDTLVGTLNSRTSAHVGDAGSDPHMNGAVAERLELEEFICVPLAVQDEPLGIMLADNKYSRMPISKDQVELLEMFCRQASLAIANARAYERIQAQLRELQLTRDRLIEAERMASVGRMASHLAHEIRNPLTAIGGFAASIARQHRKDPKTHRNAMIIYEEAQRLERTLANVLDYTRPLRPSKVPTSINDIVRQTTEQFKSYLQANNISLRMSLAEDLPQIAADGEMIKQVVINLVKNAVEAMEGKGSGALSIATGAGDGEVELVVADTGGGMEQDVLDNIFSPFFSTKIGGIGLGLSVSRQIVRQHDGRIELDSELGVGTSFTVTLAVGDPGQDGETEPARPKTRE